MHVVVAEGRKYTFASKFVFQTAVSHVTFCVHSELNWSPMPVLAIATSQSSIVTVVHLYVLDTRTRRSRGEFRGLTTPLDLSVTTSVTRLTQNFCCSA